VTPSQSPPSASAPSVLLLALVAQAGCTKSGNVFTALDANIAVSDQEIDLGEVIIGESATHLLTVGNTGRSNLDITSIEVIDGGEDYSLEVPLYVLEPEVDMEVGITLIPSSIGDMSRTLRIISDDPDFPEYDIPILAEAIDIPEPDIAVSESVLDFGVVAPDSAPVLGLLEITNEGRDDLIVQELNLSGSGAFTLSSSGGFTVAPGSSNQVIVYYETTVSTGDTAILNISSNDPDEATVSVELVGNGGGVANYPEAEITCPSVVYPPQTVTFDGAASSDPAGQALDFIWDLVEVPAGFENALYDSASGEGSAAVGESSSLFVDLAGDYEVQLRVRNEDEVLSAPATCRFAAVPENAIHVELVWDEV